MRIPTAYTPPALSAHEEEDEPGMIPTKCKPKGTDHVTKIPTAFAPPPASSAEEEEEEEPGMIPTKIRPKSASTTVAVGGVTSSSSSSPPIGDTSKYTSKIPSTNVIPMRKKQAPHAATTTSSFSSSSVAATPGDAAGGAGGGGDDSPSPSSSSSPPQNSTYQIRQNLLKKNRDTSYVPKGSVADRIKAFASSNQQKKSSDADPPPLENTGRTNPALRKRRELDRQQKEAHARLKREVDGDRTVGTGTVVSRKQRAATKLQGMVRMVQAKRVARQKVAQRGNRDKRSKEHTAATRIQAATRSRQVQGGYAKRKAAEAASQAKWARYASSQEEFERQVEAAVRMQAMIRSTLTRMKVCRMVEEMITDLLKLQEADDRRVEEADDEAKALEAARLAKQQAEEDRVSQAATARGEREASVEEGERRRAEQEAAIEGTRLAKLEREKTRKDAAALERQRRKDMHLFTGPLPWGVALLPDWWMDTVPHHTLFLDSITEDDNGEDFEEWRTGNLMFGGEMEDDEYEEEVIDEEEEEGDEEVEIEEVEAEHSEIEEEVEVMEEEEVEDEENPQNAEQDEIEVDDHKEDQNENGQDTSKNMEILSDEDGLLVFEEDEEEGGAGVESFA